MLEGYYETLLRRTADANGLAFFIGALQQGARDQDVIAGIVGILEMHAQGALRVPVDRQLRLHMATVLHSLPPDT